MKLKIKVDKGGTIPVYGSAGASGFDLASSVYAVIAPGRTMMVSTGLKIEIPEGYEIQVRPRSGLALKHSITVLNTPGTVDSDYVGTIGVILINHGDKAFVVNPGDRIAQGVFAKVEDPVTFVVVDDLKETKRGSGGFGSTGMSKEDYEKEKKELRWKGW